MTVEPISPEQGLAKGRNYCARQERAQQEVRNKLYSWGVRASDVEGVISQLISEGYLNEARFAEHYAVSKSRQKGWGLRKIEAALKQKQVSAPCIRLGLAAIDQQEQQESLNNAVAKRWARMSDADPFLRRQKVMRYFLGKGFPVEAIRIALSAAAE